MEHFWCRFGGAVTAFSPGSYQNMPQTALSLPGLFIAGDWLAQGPGTHGAKGLSQEKAWVSGLQAGNQVGVYCCLGAAFSEDGTHLERFS